MRIESTPLLKVGKIEYKWLVALVVVFGTFMSILDQTVVNNVLPALQKHFGAQLSEVQWVITAYTLTQGVVTPTTAFFADRLGTKRFYILALALFTFGSALCGFAWNLPALIVFRIIQGVGGAVLFPLSIALLFREFPPQQRGVASSIIGISALMAPAAGPALGGYLVTYATWPLIFYINVPLGLLGVLMAFLLLREAPLQEPRRFDGIGFALVATGLASILYGLSIASDTGWGSANVLSFFAAGFLLLIGFLIVELRREQPLLDLRIFTNGPFLISNLVNAMISFAFFGTLILSPIYLQTIRGLDAFQSGLLILPLAFTSVIAALIAGRLVDRVGPHIVLLPGLAIMALTTWWLAQFNLETPYIWQIAAYLLRGVGLGFLLQPLTVTALTDVPAHKYAQASSLNSVVRFVFTSLGIAVFATVVQTRASDHIQSLLSQSHPTTPQAAGLLKLQGLNAAVQDAFWLSMAVLVLAAIVACFIRIPKKAPVSPQNQREGETSNPALLFIE